jgi:protein SCO1/2
MKSKPADLGRRRFCAGTAAAWAATFGAAVARLDAQPVTAQPVKTSQGNVQPLIPSPGNLQPVTAQPVNADHGRVLPPVRIPDVAVRRSDGAPPASLAALVRGHATALHLMFTGCSSVCPIQGAIFERVQLLLPDQLERRIQLLSLSIDPAGDTPAAMRSWLQRFNARDGWIAVAPQIADLAGLLDLFGQGRGAASNHATQVSIIDRRGDLVFRTPQLPAADAIADLLRRV